MATPENPAPPPATSVSVPRILIVDDSEDDVLLAAAYIRRSVRDARFRRVDSAPDLRRALAEQDWHLVLCDHNMPGFDSERALNCVRTSAADVPFYVYSGDFNRAQAADALKAGASGVLDKRDIDGLLRVIGSAVANMRQPAASRRGQKPPPWPGLPADPADCRTTAPCAVAATD